MHEENKQDSKKYNWCERNLMFKDPANNRILFLWDFIFFVAITIESFMVPYVCCRQDVFSKEDIAGTEKTTTIIEDVEMWEIIIDIIWLLHMVKTFTTPYIKDVEVKDKCTEIAYKYITGNFILDIVSTCITLFNNYENPSFYYLKLLRLIYLL